MLPVARIEVFELNGIPPFNQDERRQGRSGWLDESEGEDLMA